VSEKFSFDRTYLEYYQDRLERASDGTRVPGLEVTAALVERMGISHGDRVLDVGCSFGRLLPLLEPRTPEVYGLEMSYDVVDVASQRNYRCVVRGSAEDSNLPSGFFNQLVLFGVFDCCNQPVTLHEIRRLLKPGGCAMFTGKNANYRDDDRLALTAERNAWRKSFPNSFSCASDFQTLLPKFGLALTEMLRFERRGDFGELRSLPSSCDSTTPFYEFAVIVHAGEAAKAQSTEDEITVSHAVSLTAQRVARASGFASAKEFFESNALDGT